MTSRKMTVRADCDVSAFSPLPQPIKGENPRDGGAWWAAVYGVAQSRTRLKRLSSILAFHSSTFAWKIPWTEEPGGWQSMGS